MRQLIGILLVAVGGTSFAISSIPLLTGTYGHLSSGQWLGIFTVGWILVIIGAISLEED